MSPRPKLDESALYLGDNGRAFCGKLRHAGQTAYFTGRDLSGQRVERLPSDAAHAHGIECEGCAQETRNARRVS